MIQPMITIIHGDDIVSSRNYFYNQKRSANNPTSFDGQFELEDIIQTAQSTGLFISDNKIFIENFFSKNKVNSTSTRNTLDYINKNSSSFELFLWEGKELQKKYINLFNNPLVKTFVIPKSIFLFLDSISPGNYKNSIGFFHKALQSTESELIFFMLQRQFRMLLTIADKKTQHSIDEVLRLLPWQKKKLERQASVFPLQKLLALHKMLYKIEISHKTGGLPYPLDRSIDFFLLSV